MHVSTAWSDDSQYYLEDLGLNPVDLLSESRPADSYCTLIRQALIASPRQRLFLHEIYDYLYQTYSYFRQSNTGWKNSVRHALSTNKEFLRIKESRKLTSRGSEWCLRDSPLGQWYLSLHNGQLDAWNSEIELNNQEHLSQMIEVSNLIPGLCDSMTMYTLTANRTPRIDLSQSPSHLLGLVPNPDFYARPETLNKISFSDSMSLPPCLRPIEPRPPNSPKSSHPSTPKNHK